MNSKSFVFITLLLSSALLSVHAFATYVPNQGDYFSYHEVVNLGSGTGDYSGYTEQTIINGKKTSLESQQTEPYLPTTVTRMTLAAIQAQQKPAARQEISPFPQTTSFILTEPTTRLDTSTQPSGSAWITRSPRAAPSTF